MKILIILKNVKQGFKRTMPWNKHWAEILATPKNNNLNYLINPRFRNVDRLFVPSFSTDWIDNNKDHATKNHFHKYYMQTNEIKDFNV